MQFPFQVCALLARLAEDLLPRDGGPLGSHIALPGARGESMMIAEGESVDLDVQGHAAEQDRSEHPPSVLMAVVYLVSSTAVGRI